ncbi:MAG: isoleucyl-tRNA synthetase [Gaiellaceae bacterium]|jgi:isoleucyl-tRNA synthetase|nr:isoleucyl-tRNA synthetase [Gaiellaceae bacterium]
MFKPLPSVPDHPALEREVLERWEAERTFERLREQNAGGPRFSFLDGPITANNPMGVHHGWGRTLKDVFQRYRAARGCDERYQNGFDCQGLWVEVEVEKELGLNSKREIEEYGIAEFAERCKERVAKYVGVMTQQSKRLGQWMDWGNDYLTFSDTNIEYIWRFLKECKRRDWLYKGHRSTQWCPRCGTSLSQHEQAGEENHRELEHPSLFVRFPLKEREGESLVIWTTTPWTLPANVAAAVKPDADYVLSADGEWRARELVGEVEVVRSARGEELVGLEYEAPFDDLPAQEGVVHRVIPWDEVALDEGTGIVHIAPGAGAEDFELSRVHNLPVLAPIDESGRFLPGYGYFEGFSTDEVVAPVLEALEERGRLVEAGTIVHRYPICWRCKTPLVFRVVDDWFISCDEIRQPLLDANDEVAWTPPQYKKRMDDWLRNMGDWNISRKRYFGLPLPFYPCECGELNVIGSRAELEERATGGLDQLQELHRPWIDAVPIRCESCNEEVRRIPEVGDAWLDAGIVPMSTLGWQSPEWIPHGYGTGAAKGLTGADLPDNAYWEQWFPADWVSESREQIRLWFYSISVMSMTLAGRLPYRAVLTYERVHDETGREMHKSSGNAIEANEAFERMGADIVRWQFCAQPPSQNINFGYGPADEVKRRLLTLWNSIGFLVTYANIAGWQPEWGREPSSEEPLDRWLVARTAQLVREAEAAYERYWTPALTAAFEAYVEDLSNWYIRRSRRRFWDGEPAALESLWWSVVQALRVVGPAMPFFADHLWDALVPDGPDSVHLAGWPEALEADERLLTKVAEVRRVVELGRQARSQSGIKLRQPLRRLVVQGADGVEDHAREIAEELSVKDVQFGPVEATELRVKPNLPLLGPKLGKELGAVRAALDAGEFEELDGGRLRVNGHELSEDEVLVERRGKEGWAVAGEDGLTVALDLALDDELELEGRARELIHAVNSMRKEAGLEITDRIVLTLPADLAEHQDWIARETLAERVEAGDELRIEKA